MAKVTNLTERGVVLRGWRVLPKSSKVVDKMGHLHDEMPDGDAYCPQAKRLADQGVLELAGYKPKALLTKVAEVVPDKAPDSDRNKSRALDPPKKAEVVVKDDVPVEDKVEVDSEKKYKKRHGKK